MTVYLVRRVLQIIPTLWGVFTLLFVLTYVMPGDPMRALLGEQYQKLSPAAVEAIKSELGLNKSLVERYVHFLSRMLRGEWGKSYILGQDVAEVIGYRFPRTLELMLGSMMVALIVGGAVGVIAAQHPYSWIDHLLTLLTLLGISIPIFWVALFAQLLLTQNTAGAAILPVAGYESGSIRHLILPALVLGLNLSAAIARVTRSAMLDVQREDYIITAHAKGLPRWLILMRHQLRNALLPIITVIALDVGYLLRGAVVIETIFNWPGLGRALVPAIERRDTPVVIGVLVFGALLFIVVNLVTDLSYALINPRIRYTL